MSESWVMIEPTYGVARLTGLAPTPIPVRLSRAPALFNDPANEGRVDLVGLADELDDFVAEQPQTAASLTPSMTRLSMAAVDQALDDAEWERAAQVARRARRWAPDHLGLQVGLGRALHGSGRHREATAQWQQAIERAREHGLWSPMLWLLTARARMELGDDRAANDLLDELCERHQDERLLRLRDAVARRIRQGGRR